AERDRDLVAGLLAAPPAAPGPVFYAPVGGMGALIDALLDVLAARRVAIRTTWSIDSLSALDADGVVLATPAWVTADLLRADVPSAAAALDAISYSSVTLVTFAFERDAVDRAIDASGFLVPRGEGLLLTAASWASTKWAHLGEPDDRVVVRASAGRIDDHRAAQLDDDALVTRLLADLATTMAVRGAPIEVRVSRWPRGFPQYAPGHLARITTLEREVQDALPHVRLAGAAYRGLGVPACIRSGREAAAALVSLPTT
ncbi:MAG: protoporphyrinogen/coproporphyrinogen oxidase, partial [Acidimicrobiaceae bacterium]